jgi:formin 2
MSKHRHESDTPPPSDQTRRAPSGGDENTLPNRPANTSLTNPGPPPATGRQGAGRGPSGGDRDTLPNRTANTSLTDPGPPPANVQASEMSEGTGSGASRGYTGPSSGNVPNTGDMIPWDPTGKIDDEVERRYRKPPAGPTPPPAGRGAAPQPPAGTTAPPTGRGATPLPPIDPTAPPSGTLPRDAGSGTSGDYSGPITSAPGVRTLQDVRSAPPPAQGARDAHHPADGGAHESSSEAPYTGPHREPGGHGEVQ